jgi:hypothetical protein
MGTVADVTTGIKARGTAIPAATDTLANTGNGTLQSVF